MTKPSPVRVQLNATTTAVMRAVAEGNGDYRYWLHETAKLAARLIDGIEEARRIYNTEDDRAVAAIKMADELERLLKGRK